MDEGELVSLIVVETFRDPSNSDVDGAAEPMSAIGEGKRAIRAKRWMLGMGEWVHGNIHVRREEALDGVDEARSAGHDVDGVARGLIPAERGLMVLAICVNGGQRELVRQDLLNVGTQCMFSPPAPTFGQLQGLQDRR